MLDFDRYEYLTFDCYGTLIDWEAGILSALRPIVSRREIEISDRQLLELFAELETREEKRRFSPYKEILVRVMVGIGERLGFRPDFMELSALVDSLPSWSPFPDTVEALLQLKERFRLAVVSNVDDDLFAQTARRLPVSFDAVITAEQVGAYKPSLLVFERAVERLGVGTDRILHVAQSLYHDIAPARTVGMATVWVDRRRHADGFGATPAASAEPDLHVHSLADLARQAVPG